MKQNLNTKHPRIKKVLKASAIAISALALTTGVLTGVTAYQHKDYSSQSQIKELATELNVENMNVIMPVSGQVKRLKYNENAPIYVKIADDFSNESKEKIQDSLDYVFSIVNPINDNYTYEIVSNNFKQKLNQTVITYQHGETYDFAGTAHDCSNLSNIGSTIVGKQTSSTTPTITIPYESEDSTNTYIHELLHIFGFDDIYTVKDQTLGPSSLIYKDISVSTFMDTRLDNPDNDITVSDYATLMSLYTKPFENKEQKELTINKYKEKLLEYQDYLDNKKIELLNQTLTKEPAELKNDYNLYTTFKVDGKITVGNISIHLDGDKYTLTSSYDNEIIETCEGDFDTFENVVMLRNIKLNYGAGSDVLQTYKRQSCKQYQYAINGDLCVGSYGNKDFFFANENNHYEAYNSEQKAIDSVSLGMQAGR